jgi:thioredoxin reductase (NADPH)
MDNFVAFLIAAAVLVFFVRRYMKDLKKQEEKTRLAAEKGTLRSDGPRAQHPHIEAAHCIGCGACTSVCPEGDVLALVGGKAVIVNGHKCIGHSLCAEVCPVGAITMVMASPSMAADMPYLTPEHETTIRNMFIVGELGGLALIKNAIAQGRDCIDTVSTRIPTLRAGKSAPDIFDVLIVGAGPAGISASLRAAERKLNYLTLDEGELGGTVAKYPRQKLVLTSPVEFPTYGKFKKTELSKEELLAFWNSVLERSDFKFRSGEKVGDVKKADDGVFTIVTANGQYRSHAVALALGRAGSPRKLGVKGEELPKVMYRLIEADHYVNKKILVVGGGDSAVEAAMGLAYQVGNQVTLSYRQASFARIKERNSQRITDCVRKEKLKVLFNSSPIEFKPLSVVLNIAGQVEEIPNDFVWVFAGGEPPNAFLKKIGVGFGTRDMTSEGSAEAKDAARSRNDLASVLS